MVILVKTIFMVDPRDEFFQKLCFKSLRVNKSTSPVVLLLGGKFPDPYTSSPYSSLRHALYECSSSSDIEFFRPEDITSWLEDSRFENLLQFEVELSGVCSNVVLIIESAGSIAELGAFSQNPTILKKLLIIKPATENPISFIQLGILRHIEAEFREEEKKVLSVPWRTSSPSEIKSEFVEHVLAEITVETRNIKDSEVLDCDNTSHVTTVVRELIRLFCALKLSEIISYLDMFQIFITKDDLKRKLYILEKFKLIKVVEYFRDVYYLSTEEKYNTLRLSSNSKKPITDYDVTLSCDDFYKKKDKYRAEAIKASKDGSYLK